jgi:hypothetical protein
MKRNPDFILRDIAGETLLVPTGQATKQFNGLITMNEVASFIWMNLDEAETEEKLVSIIMDEFEIDENTVRIDLKEFLQAMKEQNMVIDQ